MNDWYYITPKEFEYAKDKYNLNYNTIYQRVYKNGWTKAKALNTPSRKSKPKISKEHLKIAEENGITRQTLDNRLNRGWELERAITTKQGKRGRKRMFEDWIYQEAEKNGLNMNVVRYRIKNLKWDKKEACTFPVNSNYSYPKKVKDE